MLTYLPYISAFILIFFGGYISLLGFKIIKPKKDNPEFQNKMIKWHKKFGNLAKYGGIALVIWGILNLVFPSLNPYNFENRKVKKEGTTEQKEQLMNQVINSSNLLKSINQDTAKFVAKCFVDKYTEQFTLEESWKQDKMPQEQVMQIVMPIIKDCMHQYGLKTVN
jgi:hypothetical protein